MKCILLNCSNNKESYCIELSKYFKKKIEIFIADVEIVNLSEFNILPCIGCGLCINDEICPLDIEDKIYMVKNSLIESDLLILLVPVYAFNVSGFAKYFLDRISSLIYNKKFKKIDIIVLPVTDDSGSLFVGRYLNGLFTFAGSKSVYVFEIIKIKENISEQIKKIIQYIKELPK